MKVIVAIDDSPYSTVVVDAVLRRHWPADTQFRLVSVIEPLSSDGCSCDGETALLRPEVEKARLEHREELCERVRHRIEKAIPDSGVHFEIKHGRPVDAIAKSALDWEADRILIGAHGHRVCPHNMPGSVSRSVATTAPCTVEVIQEPSKIKA